MRPSKPSIRKKRASRRRDRFQRPSWLWRWHHLLSGFVVFFGIGMVIASVQYGAVIHDQARASTTDNLYGFLWASPIGWTSVNSANPLSCATPPCGSYGLNLDTNPSSPTYRQINGFAWNDDVGWICFGSSCTAASGSCASVPPTGNSADMKVTVDPVGSPAPGTVDVHGWANVCNEGNAGWISLNCNDIASCGTYPWRVKFAAAPGSYQGYFGNPTPPPDLESYGWNGASGGIGFGYFDFRRMYLQNTENTPATCGDGIDNNMNGQVDCADASCSGITNSAGVLCGTEAGHCTDGADNDGNGLTDCQDSACTSDPACIASKGEGSGLPGTTDALGRPGTAANFCTDGVDNDGNGLTDCADPTCSAVPACISTLGEGTGLGLTTDALGRPATADNFCSDGVDNNGNGLTDCADSTCATASVCLPVWLQAKYGNIYAQQGISSATTKSSVGSYCLSSNGSITGFSSQSGCTEPSSSSLTLPKSGTGYQGTLGSLDVAGILAGRYGQVTDVTSAVLLPAVLAGKVYHVTGNATLGSMTFQNGNGTTRGNGLLFVDGGDLYINGNVGYLPENLPTSIHNISSFGVIVRKNPLTGAGGNVYISPTVQTVSGAFFVEGAVHTGTAGTGVDAAPLQVFGLMAAHQFSLERRYHSDTQAAETFIFDGRAFANPPPGMSEVGKSLPASRDAF